ncbi:unnamed protein product [Auanema sp. JU1783]|nr:unnamed protein product [Auanema sp. JU1783]
MLRKISSPVLNVTKRWASLREVAGEQDPSLLYEPKFIDTKIYPEFENLNVRMQGPDYVPLEKFQSYVDRLARKFGFDIIDSYAVACQTEKAVTYKPNSTVVDNDLELSHFDRVVRLGNVPAPRLQLFVNLVRTHVPVGVKITVKTHEKTDEEFRYIPDILLKQKQEELKSLDDPNFIFEYLAIVLQMILSMSRAELQIPVSKSEEDTDQPFCLVCLKKQQLIKRYAKAHVISKN